MSKKQSDNRYTPASYKQANSSGSATKSLKSKKAMIISLIAIVAVAVIVVSLVLALWKEVIPSNIESTRPDGDTSSSLDISNSDFKYTYADAQNLQYPLTATSWTKRDSVVDSDTLMGVVDTKEDEWNGKVVYDLGQKGLNNTTNPGYPVADSENSRIFMISNAEETAASVLSSSFSVASSQYLKVSVWVKTDSITGHGAYVALRTSDSQASSDYYAVRMENISTAGAWEQYSFYIEGAKNTSQTLYFELGLGQTEFAENPSMGTAFFGEISCEKISKGAFLNNNAEEKTENEDGFYIGHTFDSSDAEESDQTLTRENEFGTVDLLTYEEYKQQFEFLPFADDENGSITRITNVSDTKAGVTYSSFTVNPPSINKSYRLSVWVRTENVAKNTGAYIYLFDNTNSAATSKTTYFEKINTDEDIENDTFNGWTEYQFYIKPSNSQAIELTLEIYLGMKNYAAGGVIPSGTLYIAELALFEIEQSDFNGTSSSSTIKTVDLDQTFDTDNLISNPSFNIPLNNSGLETVVRPANWTLYVSGNTAIGGNGTLAPNAIGDIQTGLLFKNNSSLLGELGIGENDFPLKDDDARSVLMINNKVKTSAGVQSASISLSANTFYKISVLAKGIGDAVPYVYLTDGRNVLSGYDKAMDGTAYAAENEEEGNGYVRYYFYIAVGNEAKTVYLELWLGSRNATEEQYVQGIALFDQAYCATITEEDYMKLFGKDVDGEPLDDVETVLTSSDFDKESIIMEQLTVTSSFGNVSGLDYRYFEAAETDDLELVRKQAAKVKNEEDTEELAKLKTMVENFNKKYYLDSDGNLLEEGTYLIDFEKELNFENIQEFRTYLYELQNPVEDDSGNTDTTKKEPINWIVMSSLIVTTLMLIAILILLIRKWKPRRKKANG